MDLHEPEMDLSRPFPGSELEAMDMPYPEMDLSRSSRDSESRIGRYNVRDGAVFRGACAL